MAVTRLGERAARLDGGPGPRAEATLTAPRRPIAAVRPRLARAGDSERLAAFTCSSGPAHEAEVEEHIRSEAHAKAMDSRNRTYRLLLIEDDDGDLAAVGSHQPERLMMASGDVIEAVRLVVFAIASSHRGRSLADGRRLSDVGLSTLIREGVRYRRREIVTGIVAARNFRSLAVCLRNGLTSQTAFGYGYIRLTGRFNIT